MMQAATKTLPNRKSLARTLPALALGILLAAALPGARASTPPDAIHYQGVLRDAAGEPLEGTYDMVFRFWSAETGGSEILIDQHDAANGNPITVDDGLLSVRLGQGVVSDGSGPGAYTSLAAVFRDYSNVWVAIEVEGETLSPRIQVISAGHALNAQNAENAANAESLGGLGPGSYLDTSSSAQAKAGSLAVSTLELQNDELSFGGIGGVLESNSNFSGLVLQAGSDPTDDLYLRAGNTNDHGSLAILGDAYMDLRSGNGTFYFRDQSAGLVTAILDSSGDLEVDGLFRSQLGRVELGDFVDSPFLEATGFEGSSWKLGYESAAGGYVRGERGDEIVFVMADSVDFSSGGFIVANVTPDGDLAARGVVASDGTSPPDYNRLGLGAPDGPGISTIKDTYVADDFEVDGLSYLEGPLIINEDGGNGKQQIRFYENGVNNERFQWDGDPDSKRYEFSDDVRVFGDLIADTKNFVQNHPERDDLQIVYTSLEGDEATVFTRGFARLEKGEARIELGETFRHVANPDLGLTAHLTPRGTWADLYVETLTPEVLVVRAAPDAPQDLVFDYLVLGLRIGYESFPVVREKSDEAFLPPEGWFAEDTEGDPAKERATALSRYRSMHGAAYGTDAGALEGARALKQAIGRRPRGLVYERGQEVAVRDRPLAPADADVTAGRTTPRAAEAAGPGTPRVPRAAVAGGEASGKENPSSPERGGVLRAEAGELTRMIPVGEAVEAGDVLAIDLGSPGTMRRASEAEDPRVFGIVAGDPGLILGAGETEDDDADAADAPRQAAVALGGVVRCKVDARFGTIRPGDLLAASPTPGHAMRVSDPLPGTVLGKAIESHAEGRGQIQVLVMPR